MAEIFILIFRSVYCLMVLTWIILTLYYGALLIRGYRNRVLPLTDFLFPLWRKRNGAKGADSFPVVADSQSAFWVWIIIPFCCFLMAYVPLFPGVITKLMAMSTAFWTANFGAIGSVLANYYFGKRLTTPVPAARVSPRAGGRDVDQRG